MIAHHMGYLGTITLWGQYIAAGSALCGREPHQPRLRQNTLCQGQLHREPASPGDRRYGDQEPRRCCAGIGLIAKKEVKAICESEDGGLDHAGEVEPPFDLLWFPGHVDIREARQPQRKNAASRSRFEYTIGLDPDLNGKSVSFAISPEEHRPATAPEGISDDLTVTTAQRGECILKAIVNNLASACRVVSVRYLIAALPRSAISRSASAT